MSDSEQLIEAFDARARRRGERREFFKTAFGAVAISAAGMAYATAADAQSTPAPTPTDNDILNFALNLEYLEANFYSYAVTGAPIPLSMTDGSGTFGAATGGRAVIFNDPIVQRYAQEIYQDELAHVSFLRNTLGATARVAQPAIDVGIAPNGAFSNAARAAGIITAATDVFDPYASAENFLLGAFIFEDVGVTAYKGASPLITNKTYLEAAAGILAVEAYHASVVRTVLYRKGVGTPASGTTPAVAAQPALITNAGKISDARDSLDGSADLDQGIAATAGTFGQQSNIVPTDATNSLAFSRTAGQVLNIVYLSSNAVTMGGFFPNGVNGTLAALKTSTQN